ncbi:kinase-like domain-containing protein [Hypoxylon argillaceum]|nr:kinase-like domain-containing protein [Hypoxylon argillaceum]
MAKTGSLYDDIEDSMQLCDVAATRFLPAKRLEQLLTKEAVMEALEPSKQLPGDIDTETLVCFVCTEARAVFATLVWLQKQYLIIEFYNAHFTDEMLPVIRSEKTLTSSKKEFIKQAQNTFGTKWTRHDITSFYDHQWLFLSPVFQRRQFYYKLLGDHHMPFLSKVLMDGGRYGDVEKCVIHRDHLDIDTDMARDEDRQPIIAIKELKKHAQWTDAQFKEAVHREADVLLMMQRHPHAHFIKIIAYYEMDEKKYFLFPWAEDGNLQRYWEKQTPSLDDVYLKWVFSQLTGLAGAIWQLHEKGGCRHGDIKPQNILCFKDNTGSINDQARLVIADVGLAKVHDQATLLRDKVTTTMNHTVMYSAPEAEFNIEPRSRLYDVWSIGCTYLEFVIWLLGGKPQLDQFQMEVGGLNRRGTFYEVDLSQKPPARVSSVVQKWIQHLQNDPRCSENTAIRRLIDLVATRLLIVIVPRAAPRSMESSSPSVATNEPVQVIIRQPTKLEETTGHKVVRATAQEMYSSLENIVNDIKSERCKIITNPKSKAVPPRPNNTLPLPSPNTHAVGTNTRKLVVRSSKPTHPISH